MVSRHFLRVKVLQQLYACETAEMKDVVRAEQSLLESIEQTYNLEVYLLSAVLEIRDIAENQIEEAKNKFFPTEEEKNPNMRFVNNVLFHQLQLNAELCKAIDKLKINWSEQRDMLKNIFNRFKGSDTYKDYMSKPETSYEDEKMVVVRMMKNSLFKNEPFTEFLFEKYLGWEGDLQYVGMSFLNYLKDFSQEDGTETTIYAKDYDTESAQFVECLQKETGQIFYCATNYISFLLAEPADFLSDVIYDADMADVASVQVHIDGETDLNMELDSENKQYTVNDIDVDALGTDAVDALTTLYDNLTGLTTSTLDLTDNVPTEEEPEITLTYNLKDGTTEVITFLAKDKESYYVLRNGEYSGFLAKRTAFTSRNVILEFYHRLEKAIGMTE